MKKIFFGLIVVVMTACLINPGTSTAADRVKSIGEARFGIDSNVRGQNASLANGGWNYNREAYTADPPSSGETYTTTADSVFYPGDTIYLVDRYYIGTTGSYVKYWFITDVVGTVLYFSGTNHTATTTGFKWADKAISITATGSYIFYTITLAPGQHISSKRFEFIVEY